MVGVVTQVKKVVEKEKNQIKLFIRSSKHAEAGHLPQVFRVQGSKDGPLIETF